MIKTGKNNTMSDQFQNTSEQLVERNKFDIPNT
jgi:hypothetical protein